LPSISIRKLKRTVPTSFARSAAGGYAGFSQVLASTTGGVRTGSLVTAVIVGADTGTCTVTSAGECKAAAASPAWAAGRRRLVGRRRLDFLDDLGLERLANHFHDLSREAVDQGVNQRPVERDHDGQPGESPAGIFLYRVTHRIGSCDKRLPGRRNPAIGEAANDEGGCCTAPSPQRDYFTSPRGESISCVRMKAFRPHRPGRPA